MELVFVGHDAPHLIKGLILIQVQRPNDVFLRSPFRRFRIPDPTVLGDPIGFQAGCRRLHFHHWKVEQPLKTTEISNAKPALVRMRSKKWQIGLNGFISVDHRSRENYDQSYRVLKALMC